MGEDLKASRDKKESEDRVWLLDGRYLEICCRCSEIDNVH